MEGVEKNPVSSPKFSRFRHLVPSCRRSADPGVLAVLAGAGVLPDQGGGFEDYQDNHDAYKNDYQDPGHHNEIPRKLHTV